MEDTLRGQTGENVPSPVGEVDRRGLGPAPTPSPLGVGLIAVNLETPRRAKSATPNPAVRAASLLASFTIYITPLSRLLRLVLLEVGPSPAPGPARRVIRVATILRNLRNVTKTPVRDAM